MKRAGVAGWPVSHSLSPVLHGYWLKHYKIEAQYTKLPITPEDLSSKLEELPKQGYVGINLTIPHKETTFHICRELGVADAMAHRIGAVNTLVFAEGEIVKAMNTDAYGFIQNLRQGAPQWQPEKTSVVILGAGGAARAIAAALLDVRVPSIHLLNRTRARALELAQDFPGITVGDWEKPAEVLAQAHLLINATSLGMQGGKPLELSLESLPKSAIVTDIVYTPLQTDLLKQAKARGNPTVDGLGMLLHQAVPAFEAWFGVKPEVTPELRECVLRG